MADHLTFLERQAAHVRMAGPLFEGAAGAGGLWLVEADDEPAVRILAWRQVFADGRCLI